jgi:hypothetical protein
MLVMGPSQNILGMLILTKFEVTKMARITMATQVKDLLSSYSLYDKLIAYVKDGGGCNLSTLTQTLNFVVTCALLGLVTP